MSAHTKETMTVLEPACFEGTCWCAEAGRACQEQNAFICAGCRFEAYDGTSRFYGWDEAEAMGHSIPVAESESTFAVIRGSRTMGDHARSKLMDVSRNIVNQLADSYMEDIPSDQWVKVRQASNDRLDKFVYELLSTITTLR